MRKFLLIPTILTSFVLFYSGCDKTVSHKETEVQNKDGSYTKHQEDVKRDKDGNVTKTEKNVTEKPNPDNR